MAQVNEVVAMRRKRHLPLIFLGVTLAIALGGYVALCVVARNSDTIFPHYHLGSVDLGGVTQDQAATLLAQELPQREVSIFLPTIGEEGVKTDSKNRPIFEERAAKSISYGDLGITAKTDYAALAARAYNACHSGRFFSDGWTYLTSLTGHEQSLLQLTPSDDAAFSAAVERLAEELSSPAQNTEHSFVEAALRITKAKSGLYVGASALEEDLRAALAGHSGGEALAVQAATTERQAVVQTAQALYEQLAGEMKNAGYDPVSKSIYDERIGAEFDVARAQQLLDAAAPGETVEIPAEIQQPVVTRAQLEGVLFRDTLGSCTTSVSGSSGRIGNVRLSASAIHDYILNSGEIFSYNPVVGKRTEENGYKPAPAYVKGETVDEIGGGICQTSSTLYLAALRSNLKIVERYAHRYVPAYIPWGMDATVSWGGPEFRFQNDTEYPVRIEAVLSAKNQLTITFYGTKTDDSYVKITNETLATIPYEVEYVDDPTLPAGKERVQQTPYTGYKVRTYRNVYSGDDKLLSSTFEASSYYKPRNRIIHRAPVAVMKPEEIPVAPPETPGTIPENPSTVPETPTEPTPPVVDNPAGSETPPVIDIDPTPMP